MNQQTLILLVLLFLFTFALSRAWRHLKFILTRDSSEEPGERRRNLLATLAWPAVLCISTLAFCVMESGNLNDATQRAKSVASNVIASQVPNVERLGFAGAEGLNLAADLETAYSLFARELEESGKFDVLDSEPIRGDPVYLRLAAAQPRGDALTLAISQNLAGGGNSSRRRRTEGRRTAAVVFFAAANGFINAAGELSPAIVKHGQELARLADAEAAELARSLGADYLISVGFVPQITAYEPGNMAGYIVVTHRVRMRDATGAVILDQHSSADFVRAATGRYLMIDSNLTQEQRLAMGQSRLRSLFPTNEQRLQIAAVERRLMSQAFSAEAQVAAREIVENFP